MTTNDPWALLREYAALDDMHFPSAAPYQWMQWTDKMRAALAEHDAQQAQQEPVAYAELGVLNWIHGCTFNESKYLYAAQPAAQQDPPMMKTLADAYDAAQQERTERERFEAWYMESIAPYVYLRKESCHAAWQAALAQQAEPRRAPLPFAVFDEFGVSCDDRVQDHYTRAQPAAQQAEPQYRDAYEGCREDLLDWKRRALKAEEQVRNLVRALDEEEGRRSWASL